MCRLCKGTPRDDNVPTELDPMWVKVLTGAGTDPPTVTVHDVLRLEGAEPILERHLPELDDTARLERFLVGVMARRFLSRPGPRTFPRHQALDRAPDGTIPEAELERLRRQAAARHGDSAWELTGPPRASPVTRLTPQYVRCRTDKGIGRPI